MAPLLKRKGAEAERARKRAERKFIDLADFRIPDDPDEKRKHLKVAEIHRFEDLRNINEHLYNGDVVLLDCSLISDDEMQMKRIIREVRTMGREIGGDVAGISRSLIAITPSGIDIDRTRIRGSF